jgi:hypothetical protein
MGFRGERVLAVVGAMAIAVVGFDGVTYAATGSSLILGRANRASTVTTVQNTGSGAALNLVTRSSSSAPFTTNAKGRVRNLYASRALSADTLGGHTYAQTVTAAGPQVWAAAVEHVSLAAQTTEQTIASVTVPAGRYLLSAKLYTISSGPPYTALCSLAAGATTIDFTDLQPTGQYGTLSLLGTATVTGRTAMTVKCNDVGKVLDVWQTKLIATKVAAIH